MAQPKIQSYQLDNILPANLNSGSGASSTTFWRGDGVWSTPAGGSSSNTYKEAVRVATTANGTLATAFDNASPIDGITLATNDRILIKNQTTASENGIYIVQASGAPVRATDFDTTGAEVSNGAIIPVQFGTQNGGSTWQLTANGGTIGNSFRFTQVGLFAVGGGISSVTTAPVAAGGAGALAIGPGSSASGTNAVAIGNAALASGTGTLAIGSTARAVNLRDVVIAGGDNTGTLTGGGGGCIVIGTNSGGSAETAASGSIALFNARSSGERLCSGTNSFVANWHQTGVGTMNNSILIGTDSIGGGMTAATRLIALQTGSSIAVTNIGSATSTDNIAIGAGFGFVADVCGKVVMQGVPGFGVGTSENAFVTSHAQTTTPTATEVFLNYASNTKRLVLPDNFSYAFVTRVVARQYGGASGAVGATKSWEIRGLIKRLTGVGTTTLVGPLTSTVIAEDSATTAWLAQHTADATNGSLKLTVTGETNKNIRWSAKTEFLSLQ